jgi:hypothetical protein
MVFSCNHCGKPISCVGTTHKGEIIHHTCREELIKEESEEELVPSEE